MISKPSSGLVKEPCANPHNRLEFGAPYPQMAIIKEEVGAMIFLRNWKTLFRWKENIDLLARNFVATRCTGVLPHGPRDFDRALYRQPAQSFKLLRVSLILLQRALNDASSIA